MHELTSHRQKPLRDLIDAATPLQAQTAFDQLERTLSARIEALDRVVARSDRQARSIARLSRRGLSLHRAERSGGPHRRVLADLNALLSHEARGRLIREGATVVIAGRVNAGKSSLFNALVGHDRAIVTDIPGTTRDLLTETIDLDGLAITLVDTAGERETHDAVEREGVVPSCARAGVGRPDADCDRLRRGFDRRGSPLLELASSATAARRCQQSDRAPKWAMEGALRVSTLRNTGLPELRRAMLASLTGEDRLRDPAPISNLRHVCS